jgi:hypothetical protein
MQKAASPYKKSIDLVSLPISLLTFKCNKEDPLDNSLVT